MNAEYRSGAYLRAIFKEDECLRLERLKKEVIRGGRSEFATDRNTNDRLVFAKWLVMTGRITDQIT